MKIDFIIGSLGGGGAERVLALIVNSLAKNRRYDISLITFYKGNEAYELTPNIKRVQLKSNKLIKNHTLNSMIYLLGHYKSKSQRPDLILSFSTSTNFITILVAKFYSIKIIAQEHTSYLGYDKKRSSITTITRKHLYRLANLLTVLTYLDVPHYKKLGVEVYVMPNPCSFKPITENNHLRKKIILAAGNLNRYDGKGFDNLIRLMVPIFKNHPDWRLKIAGSGEEGLNHLTQLAKRAKVLDKVIFTGFIDNISDVMNESSIFILSSKYEGLPMALLEAMSQGMACIAYNCLTGPSDIIENNKNGLLIENQNTEKMQQGLLKLIENEELRNKLSNEGIKSMDKFNIDVITERYESLLNKLVYES
ncbi:glycosyltransferase family 4 protein [Gelidibacter mesophilus]|uniref:glycosyltransferase family 4 protein n=1 Tax=Gelidibacter mesophilus TaxID=169050 RepID=UPI00040EA95E|nr:glycosyltransferase family 4 protein [Gelidibacter mesophilus]